MERKKGMTKKPFKDYWLKKHAPLVKETLKEVRRYRVNIPIKDPTNKTSPFEGIGEIWFYGYEESVKAFESKAGKKAVADLDNFVGKFQGSYVEEHTIV